MTGSPTQLYRDRVVSIVNHDMAGETPVSMALLDELSALDDFDPCDYEPLHDVLDPDCLDGLFQPVAGGKRRVGGQISFPFAGYHVTVESDGTITIRSRR